MKRKKAQQIEMFAAPPPEAVKTAPVVKELTPQAEKLLANFEVFSQAEGGIERLRQLILGLATMGELISQNPTAESAAVLITRAKEERARLVEAGKIKRIKPLEPTKLSIPNRIPSNWVLSTLDDISLKITDGEHATPERENSGHYLLSARNIRNGFIDVSDVDYVGSEEFARIRKRCDPDAGDILLSCSGSIGRVAVVDADNKYAMVRSAALIKHSQSSIDSHYLALALRAPLLQRQMEQSSKQSAQPNLFIDPIRRLIVPLPPLAEQKRIVAKVDELMKLSDELETRQAKQRETGARLTKSALDALAQADGPEELATAWERVVGNFEGLVSRADDVKKVRETVLSLAVRGRLAMSNPSDEPISLAQYSQLGDDYPQNWKSATVFELLQLKSGNTFSIDRELVAGQYPYVKVSDMNLPENQHEITTSSRFIHAGPLDLKHIIPANSIIFPKRGGAIATNKKRLVRSPIFVDTNTMAMICPPTLDLSYVYLWFSGIDLWKLNSGTSVPQINNKDIGPLSVPLPPLAEQKRIVAKVDQLMGLCDELEAKLRLAEETSRKVAEALVTELLQA